VVLPQLCCSSGGFLWSPSSVVPCNCMHSTVKHAVLAAAAAAALCPELQPLPAKQTETSSSAHPVISVLVCLRVRWYCCYRCASARMEQMSARSLAPATPTAVPASRERSRWPIRQCKGERHVGPQAMQLVPPAWSASARPGPRSHAAGVWSAATISQATVWKLRPALGSPSSPVMRPPLR
jgi:hypothetical protein